MYRHIACIGLAAAAISFMASTAAASSAGLNVQFGQQPSVIGPNPVSPIPKEIATAYAADWDVSEATADAHLETEDRGIMMPTWQAVALGGAFGGVWFDNTRGTFYVGIAASTISPAALTEKTAAAEVVTAEMEMAGHVVYQRVQWSMAELEAANDSVVATMQSLETAHEATVGIDVAANDIEIYLSAAASSAGRQTAEAISRTAAVKTVVVEKPAVSFAAHQLACPPTEWDSLNGSYTTYCNQPLRSAAAMDDNTNGTACSIGALFGGSSGNVYAVTAGHCLYNNLGHWWSTVDASTGQRHNIGEAAKAVNGSNGDMGMIKMNEGSYWYSPYAAEANIPYQTATYELQHPTASYAGMYQCWSGAQSNTHSHMGCGTVQRVEVNDGFSSHMVESYGPNGGSEAPSHDLCLYDGDSGGPVITDHLLDGLISAGYSCGEGAYTAWYASATRLAEYYGVVFVGAIN